MSITSSSSSSLLRIKLRVTHEPEGRREVRRFSLSSCFSSDLNHFVTQLLFLSNCERVGELRGEGGERSDEAVRQHLREGGVTPLVLYTNARPIYPRSKPCSYPSVSSAQRDGTCCRSERNLDSCYSCSSGESCLSSSPDRDETPTTLVCSSDDDDYDSELSCDPAEDMEERDGDEGLSGVSSKNSGSSITSSDNEDERAKENAERGISEEEDEETGQPIDGVDETGGGATVWGAHRMYGQPGNYDSPWTVLSLDSTSGEVKSEEV